MAVYAGPEVVTNGLVFALDAGNPQSYPGSGTTCTNLSDNSITATLVNGPTYSTDNKGYFIVDGVNDYIVTSTLPAFGTEYSFSFWVYLISGSQTEHQLFVCSNIGISATLVGGIRTWTSYEAVNGNVRIGSALSVGVWYNFVLTNTGSTTRFFVNGNFTHQFATGPSLSSAGLLYFWNGVTRYMNARLSFATAYNRALSAAEIQQNFNALRGRFGI